MQKLVTLAINLEQLRETSEGAFALKHVDQINKLLEEGWIIEEYEFLSSGPDDRQAIVLFILNDEPLSEYNLSAEESDEGDEPELRGGPNEDGEEQEPDDEDRDESGRTYANAPMI